MNKLQENMIKKCLVNAIAMIDEKTYIYIYIIYKYIYIIYIYIYIIYILWLYFILLGYNYSIYNGI